MDWAFTHRDFLALMSLIYPENAASIRVATKLGETLQGDATLHGKTVLRYVITRPEWEAMREGVPLTGS